MQRIAFVGLFGLTGALVLLQLSVQAAVPSTSLEPSTDRAGGCVAHYHPSADYFPGKARIRRATGFTLEYHKHYKVLTVLTPWPGARERFRYVLVHCGTPQPSGFDDAQRIEVPIATIAVLSPTHLPHLERLGELDRLVGISDRDLVYSARVRARIADASVKVVGRGANLNVESLLALAPDLVTAVGHDQPQYNAHPVLQRAGIHVAINSEYIEATPLGRAEWLKFTAAFFNKEADAEQVFDDLARRYEAYAAKARQIPVQHRPTVFGGTLFRDTWHVPGGESFVAQLIEDAGGVYLWAEDTHRAAVPLNFEMVLDRAAHAAYWFIGRSEWFTQAEMLAENERYASFKAFRSGNVYNSNARVNRQGANDFWETAILEPHMLLADLIKILHPDLLPDHQLRYYRRLE